MPRLNTKTHLKLRVQDIVLSSDRPLKTSEVQQVIEQEFSNVRTSPNRLTKYIKAHPDIIFDKKIKSWTHPKIKPKP